MRDVTIGFAAMALMALAGCRTTSPGAIAPPAPPAVPAASTGTKAEICNAAATRRFGVSGDALSLSNEYPTGNGDAIDGVATQAQDFRRFRCDFDRAGAFAGIADLPVSGA